MNAYHEIDADIIIIGAGISGLTAALTLMEKEPFLRILVLEASDRIGGRVYSIPLDSRSGTLNCDMGGQWICSQQKILIDLMVKLGVSKETNLSSGSTNIFVEFNTKIHKVKRCDAFCFCSQIEKYELSGFIRKIDEMCNLPIHPGLQYVSMEEFLNENIRSETIRSIIKYTILIHCGVEPNQITVWFYIFFCISTHGIANQLINNSGRGLFEFSIKDGAGEICQKIAAKIHERNILFDTKATSIINNLHDVEIRTNRRTYFSYNVIVALPPSSIVDIQFTPKLPNDKLWALKQANEGDLVKFVINYKEAFWKRFGCSGDIFIIDGFSQQRPILFCLDCTTNKNPTLAGFAIKLKRDNLERRVLEELKVFLGDLALDPISFMSSTNFENCFVGGSPMSCFDYLGDDVRFFKNYRRIFWAGAEASLNWYGHIAGAVFAGKRAALEVLYDLRPALLTVDDMQIASPTLDSIRSKKRPYHDIFGTLAKWYIQAPIGICLLYLTYKCWEKGEILTRVTRSLVKTPAP